MSCRRKEAARTSVDFAVTELVPSTLKLDTGRCGFVQWCESSPGMAFAIHVVMPNFFLAGSEMIEWDLEVVARKGPDSLRLTFRHPLGSIVEYFTSAEAALAREQELEELLIAARCAAGPAMLEPIHLAR